MPRLTIELPQTLAALIAKGYWSIVPQSWSDRLLEHDSIVLHPLSDAPPTVTTYAAFRREARNPLLRDFIDLLFREAGINFDLDDETGGIR